MVIAIIGILVAILLPALESSREVARKAMCQSQMRQTTILTQSYYNDFGLILPGRYAIGVNAGGQTVATPAIHTLYFYYDEINGKRQLHYLDTGRHEAQRGRSLFACPSGYHQAGNPNIIAGEPGLARSNTYPGKPGSQWGFLFDYTINNFGGLTPGFRGISDSEVLYFVESKSAVYDWNSMRNAGIKLRNDPDRQHCWRARIPHRGTSNYSAWDGHVSSIHMDRYIEIESYWWTQPSNFLPVRFDPQG